MATIDDLKKILVAATGVYGVALSPEALEVWVDFLTPHDAQAIRSAFRQHMMVSKFFPKPCEILDILKPQRSAWVDEPATDFSLRDA